MNRKLFVFEIIVLLITGIMAGKFYYDYKQAIKSNEQSKARLAELEEDLLDIEKECDELGFKIDELKENVDTDVLELWKRKTQKLEEYLKQ